MEIPETSFPVKSDLNEYEKYKLDVTLNGKSISMQWADQNATQEFVPPIILQMQNNLDNVIAEIIK